MSGITVCNNISKFQPTFATKKTDDVKSPVLKQVGVGTIALLLNKPITKTIKKPFLKIYLDASKELKSANEQLRISAENAFIQSGLFNKGIKYTNFSNFTDAQINSYVDKIIPKSPFTLLRNFSKKKLFKVFKQINKGVNAIYHGFYNRIYVNKDKTSAFAFHEMGHALNKHSQFGKFLQKAVFLKSLTWPILLIAAFKPKKAEGEKPSGMVDKTMTFIKNNAGKLTFAVCLPRLCEEGLASFRGIKLAKPYLSSNAIKLLTKTYGAAFLTYLSSAIAATTVARVAVLINDKLNSTKNV